MNHLCLGVAQILDGERDGTLHTVQIVVDTQAFQYEKRGSNATQTQLCREVLLKEVLNQFDTLLRLLHVEQRFILDWL